MFQGFISLLAVVVFLFAAFFVAYVTLCTIEAVYDVSMAVVDWVKSPKRSKY